jgi:hypothetical protein
MATQSVVHPVEQSKPAVASFPAPETVTQLELLTLLSLRGRVHQIETQIAAAEQSIATRLKKGCAVEKGNHSAELDPSLVIK